MKWVLSVLRAGDQLDYDGTNPAFASLEDDSGQSAESIVAHNGHTLKSAKSVESLVLQGAKRPDGTRVPGPYGVRLKNGQVAFNGGQLLYLPDGTRPAWRASSSTKRKGAGAALALGAIVVVAAVAAS